MDHFPSQASATDDQRAEREALVHRHIVAEFEGDAAGVVETFKQPRYDLVTTGVILEGADAVADRVRGIAAAMPGARMEIASLRHADDAIIVETVTSGLHSAPLLGIEPTGRAYRTRGVAIFRFEGADLVEEIVYYDRLNLIEQLTGAD